MLIGEGSRPNLPPLPDAGAGILGIIQYLADLHTSLDAAISGIVTGTVGFAGLRGLSSSGIVSRNLIKQSLDIGGGVTNVWSFINIEPDTSYSLFFSPSSPASTLLRNSLRMTTGVILVSTGLAGETMDILLLR